MGSKRAQKAKKRSKREARRQTRRARNATDASQHEVQHQAMCDPHIGYVAGNGPTMISDGEACIVTGSREKMRQILQRLGDAELVAQYTIQAIRFHQIFYFMKSLGAAYCFDEEAYGRFLEPARRHGMPLTPQDFTDPGPLGTHLVRVRLRLDALGK